MKKRLFIMMTALVSLVVISCDVREDTKQPVACFTASSTVIMVGETIDFSSECSEFAQVYQWDFGNNQTSVAVNPSHRFDQVGEHTVSLIVLNKNLRDETALVITVEDASESVDFDPKDYNSSPSGGWEAHYVDDFDTDNGDWSIENGGGVNTSIESGYYTIELKGTEGSWYFWTTGAEMPSSAFDYDIDTYLTVERDDSTYGAGLVWGLENTYLDGNDFRLANYENALWYSVGDPENDWLADASGWENLYGNYLAKNWLTVRKFNDTYYVFLNKILIAEHSYLSFGELFGFYVGEECRVKIDVIGVNLMNWNSKKSGSSKVLEGTVNAGNGKGLSSAKANNFVKRLR